MTAFLRENTLQESGENPVQAFSQREIAVRKVLWDSNRFQDRQKDFDEKFDWYVVTDLSGVSATSEKLHKGFFDNLPSARDQVFGKRRLFPAQIANEYRLN